MSKFALVLSPCFSKYDVLESGIINIYLKRAFQKLGMNPYLLNLITDTPYMLYQYFGLYNPKMLTPSGLSLGQQQTLLILSLTCSLLDHIVNSSLIFICGNGPVVNSGFATLLGVATTLGKPIVYWKDDARHLWGFNDNPMMIGTLPDVAKKLYNPPNLPIRLSEYARKSCGPDVLPSLIQTSLQSVLAPGVPSQHIMNYIKLGAIINTAFAPTSPDQITYANCWTTDDNIVKSFRKLFDIITKQGASLITPEDLTYLTSEPQSSPRSLPSIELTGNRKSVPLPQFHIAEHIPHQKDIYQALQQTKS